MDEEIRKLERLARQGDAHAIERLRRSKRRAGRSRGGSLGNCVHGKRRKKIKDRADVPYCECCNDSKHVGLTNYTQVWRCCYCMPEKYGATCRGCLWRRNPDENIRDLERLAFQIPSKENIFKYWVACLRIKQLPKPNIKPLDKHNSEITGLWVPMSQSEYAELHAQENIPPRIVAVTVNPTWYQAKILWHDAQDRIDGIDKSYKTVRGQTRALLSYFPKLMEIYGI